MNRHTLLVVLMLAVPVIADDNKNEKQPDELTGTWIGKTAQTNEEKGRLAGIWTFKAGKLTLEINRVSVEYTYKIDATKKPKQLDYTGPDKEVRICIYRIEKDTLTICEVFRVAPNTSANRPEGFDTTKRDDVIVMTLTKAE